MSDLPKKKCFLLMIDEQIVPFIANLVPGIQYVEVEALTMKDNEDFVLLGNPKPKAPECHVPPEEVCPVSEESKMEEISAN